MVPPPTPFHILRAHQAPLTCVSFSAGNVFLLAGDQDGYVSVSDLGSRRVLAYWKAHEGGVLNVEEVGSQILSQGRDNKIHLYEPFRPDQLAAPGSAAAAKLGPSIQMSMDSNSLNFCRFALTPYKDPGGKDAYLMALPNLIDSELIDVYAMPSGKRLHSKINFTGEAKGTSTDTRSGLVMGIALQVVGDRLALVAGYEDGRVDVWTAPTDTLGTMWDGKSSKPGTWTRLWSGKAHNEAVMALAVDPAFTRAFTVSADHLLVRIDLGSILSGDIEGKTNILQSYSTKQIGNSSLSVNHDGKVVAVGGWDGRIRLFSAATFKPLGTLSYHRESVSALAFARPPGSKLLTTGEEDTIELGAESDSDDEELGPVPRDQWLASGGKDRRIALWGLKAF